jgi:two-component system chemotaxis response regulator CheY
MRAVVRYALQDLGFDFVEASTGAEAEQVLQESVLFDLPIDLVILDWMMPQMSGVEFLEKIRAVERFKMHPPVMMLTAETYPSQIEIALRYGVKKYVTKPFTREYLSATVREVLEQEKNTTAEVKHAV